MIREQWAQLYSSTTQLAEKYFGGACNEQLLGQPKIWEQLQDNPLLTKVPIPVSNSGPARRIRTIIAITIISNAFVTHIFLKFGFDKSMRKLMLKLAIAKPDDEAHCRSSLLGILRYLPGYGKEDIIRSTTQAVESVTSTLGPLLPNNSENGDAGHKPKAPADSPQVNGKGKGRASPSQLSPRPTLPVWPLLILLTEGETYTCFIEGKALFPEQTEVAQAEVKRQRRQSIVVEKKSPTFAKMAPALDQSVGYGIVLGVGFLFAFGMMAATYVLKRYKREVQTSEMFTTAGRTVKSGLVGSAVVSSWTWAATLLQSSGICYRYGVSGPFWYASGATVQILLFATLAIELKRRAPNAHTFLEVIKARYGTVAHIVFIVFGLMTNILVTMMLLAGGSATVNALTGMPTVAAIYLLPLGVTMYTLFGGLKATFLTDYIHTLILLIIIAMMFELLQEATERHPVAGNQDGSYLTMRSSDGIKFFVINIVGNFGTVFLDNGYYNKAIAASPVHALPGYLIGGISWFPVPFLTATTMGLTALALESSPSFPTYPNRIPDAEVSAGLALPYAAVALLGKGGAVATLLMVFMAVTSASSAELIAVSSIFTYDIYRTYINPNASGRRLIAVSHISVVCYALIIASASVGLYYNGISMGYIYVLMGVLISAAVLPATLTLLWKGQNKWAAALTPPIGTALAIVAWLVTAKKTCGKLDIECTGSNDPMLAGNVTALLVPVVLIPIFTLIFGLDKYDWLSMANIRKADDHDVADQAGVDLEDVPDGHVDTAAEHEAEQKSLKKALKISVSTTVFMTIALLVLWPLPMYGSKYVFSKSFFTGWVSVAIIWIFVSIILVGLLPLWESRETIIYTTKAIFTGKKPPSTQSLLLPQSTRAMMLPLRRRRWRPRPPQLPSPLKTLVRW
ncbi:unnamed protein product [Parascedosporium putredinis]|uniref:Urea active transporter n=1 Tax=Parascedosporium putredinis TaxID=1442378 RepID=A0A9P1MAB3_9PEZI|nr:unnamed protein product [Parascedosporium putredinis]CAI7993600.1 unnamed protein product [Parascedosporium putredinis]